LIRDDLPLQLQSTALLLAIRSPMILDFWP
jgi:hypothetical protein